MSTQDSLAEAGVVEGKIARIASGGPPRVLDLCAGAGGMSLGFKWAGYDLRAHVEFTPEACDTYERNLGEGVESEKASRRGPLDLSTCSVDEIRRSFDLEDSNSAAFDIVIAGLPCQAFARIGRSKLTSVRGVPDAYKSDPRAVLYKRFLAVVEEAMPIAVVVENVPDILNFGGRNVPEEISEHLGALGYDSCYGLLNAARYGVPQHRERLFLIAYRRELGVRPGLPTPSHATLVPRGYESSRRVALKHVPADSKYFHEASAEVDGLPAAVTAKDALDDLPRITYHLQERPAARSPRLRIRYRRAKTNLSPFAVAMRSLPDGTSAKSSSGHVVRLTQRDFETFRRMSAGDDYPKALKVAERRFEEDLARATNGSSGEVDWEAIRRRTVPPYDGTKFPNKWWKMIADAPARTLTAHLGKDTYTHIHYDSKQARMISLREAARLQSFPDWFDFGASMNSGFRQIGNAVPPLLARAVAMKISADLIQSVEGGISHSGNED